MEAEAGKVTIVRAGIACSRAHGRRQGIRPGNIFGSYLAGAPLSRNPSASSDGQSDARASRLSRFPDSSPFAVSRIKPLGIFSLLVRLFFSLFAGSDRRTSVRALPRPGFTGARSVAFHPGGDHGLCGDPWPMPSPTPPKGTKFSETGRHGFGFWRTRWWGLFSPPSILPGYGLASSCGCRCTFPACSPVHVVELSGCPRIGRAFW